jgi:oligopeptidase A
MSKAPFLDEAFLVKWSELTADHVVPDVRTALQGAEAAVAEIAARAVGEATYDNTVRGLERATEALGLAWGKVGHLMSVADSPALREAHDQVLAEVSGFYARIPLNAELWLRVKAVAESAEGRALEGIYRRHLDETVADFREAGADLSAEVRTRLEAIQAELAKVTQKYGENVLDATNGFQVLVEDPARLAGLPEHAKAAALTSARDKGLGSDETPVWRFTLHQPSQEPVMTYADDETLRRELWEGAVAVGAAAPHDNAELVKTILRLRQEEAGLLGKADFADHVLRRRMAKSGAAAQAFLEDLKGRTLGTFGVETGELEAFKAAQTGGAAGRLKAWEAGYWAEKLRRERYAFDEEKLRPYLPMDRVIDGLFKLAARVFGLMIAEVPTGSGEVEVWDPAVKFYTMHDGAGRHLGSFYADWYPREAKRGGAWMGYLVTGGPQPDGARAPHLGYICGNMTPPQGGRPALLTHREVETVFHEFGHLLHHLLGEVEIKSLNGVNVAWDFVELPSQIMENWCWERESLDLLARHHETGETIPEELFAKMVAAKNFRAATAMARQLQFGVMDLLLHRRTTEFLEGDLVAKVAEATCDLTVPTEPAGRPIVLRFSHLFSDPVGYAAGYYSYKWAEVLEADAFTRFQREGIFNAETGGDFVRHILSRGNSADPAELFRAFMGRDPEPAALLRRCGLEPAA